MSLRSILVITIWSTLVIFQPAFAQQKMVELAFSRDVANRNPVNPFKPRAFCEIKGKLSAPVLSVKLTSASRIFFWNRIASSQANDMRHTWSKDGVKVAEVDIGVGESSGFRIWSSKKLIPQHHVGNWTVVVSRVGNPETVLCTARFSVE